ncbi:hypothetical protein SAMD00019534_097900 [Acytostelium subglobosum LB1]|uniref:hypothetical protein n=1 Tax=Acytostelium subglobosum LB1 TaxID=1410327 RepID=UPI0006447E87|nr:hypothetical protein SAMD00019534_097900 [Acytostelium subglobosum LB1]GAM26615.1 hypothetical protein SAMD00019534_097900 [Acytostelium subglobosum LB1]|eukprot:XP_012750276.1 hypothetical protein SAMD00019534_097900 [Acytostelium subglobosum LB1]
MNNNIINIVTATTDNTTNIISLFKAELTKRGVDWNSQQKPTIHLDTKYYSCDVQLHIVESSSGSAEDAVSSSGVVASSLDDVKIVFVLYDASNITLDTIKQRYNALEESYDAVESIVLLEVSSNPESTSSDIEQWCADMAIENIYMDNEKHRSREQQRDSDTDSSRIKYGTERLVEILETTMWDDMEYKTESRPTASSHHVKEEENEEEDGDVTASAAASAIGLEQKQQEQDDIVKILEQTMIGSTSSSQKQPATGGQDQSLNQSLKSLETYFEKLAKPSPSAPKDKVENEDEDDDLNKVNEEFGYFDMMQGYVGQLQELRGQMQGLPDDQRRAMSAKIAMMFASQFGGDDDDLDDEDLD